MERKTIGIVVVIIATLAVAVFAVAMLSVDDSGLKNPAQTNGIPEAGLVGPTEETGHEGVEGIYVFAEDNEYIELRIDGTFIVSDGSAVLEAGTWEQRNSEICLTLEEDNEEMCLSMVSGNTLISPWGEKWIKQDKPITAETEQVLDIITKIREIKDEPGDYNHKRVAIIGELGGSRDSFGLPDSGPKKYRYQFWGEDGGKISVVVTDADRVPQSWTLVKITGTVRNDMGLYVRLESWAYEE